MEVLRGVLVSAFLFVCLGLCNLKSQLKYSCDHFQVISCFFFQKFWCLIVSTSLIFFSWCLIHTVVLRWKFWRAYKEPSKTFFSRPSSFCPINLPVPVNGSCTNSPFTVTLMNFSRSCSYSFSGSVTNAKFSHNIFNCNVKASIPKNRETGTVSRTFTPQGLGTVLVHASPCPHPNQPAGTLDYGFILVE